MNIFETKKQYEENDFSKKEKDLFHNEIINKMSYSLKSIRHAIKRTEQDIYSKEHKLGSLKNLSKRLATYLLNTPKHIL